MDTTTIRDHLAEIRDMLDAIDGSAGDLVHDPEPGRYVDDDGNFNYPITGTGAEISTDGATAYIDVSTIKEIPLDDDTIPELIEALRALQVFRAAQAG